MVLVVEAPESPVLRLLAADIIREMIHGGVPCSLFWPTKSKSNPYTPFPSASKADSEWVGKMIEACKQQDGKGLSSPLSK